MFFKNNCSLDLAKKIGYICFGEKIKKPCKKTAMSKKDVINRMKILYQQIHLMTIYREEFVAKMGVRGYEYGINERLDEINRWRKILTKMDES